MRLPALTLTCSLLLVACEPTTNQPPTASGKSLTTAEDTNISFTLEATDPEGKALVFTHTPPAHGTLTLLGTSYIYAPAPDYFGPDSASVTVSDGAEAVTVAVTITVTPVNDAPVAVDDTAASGAAITSASLVANDTDVDGDTLTVTAVGAASVGTVALAAGVITFTPPPGYSGSATFEYTVSDGTATDTGLVTLSVTASNQAPVAVDDTALTAEDSAVVITSATLTGNDTDPDTADTLSVTAVSNATGGTVALAGSNITFTPTADFSGAAGFDYTVSDGALTDTGHVVVTVTPVNDAPVAVDDTATTAEDIAAVLTGATLTGNDTDVDGDTLMVSAVSNATGGTVVLAGSSITFTPTPNTSGAAGFDYTVSDGTVTDTGHVALTVTAVNDAPVAVDDTATTAEDTALVVTAATLLANDTDLDGPTATVTAVSNAAGGTVVLAGSNITFTPTANLTGAAGFDYTVSDGTGTDTGHVTVSITAVNDAPVALDDTVTTDEATPASISAATLLANDTDADGTTPAITAVGNPVGGTVSLAGTTITFTPTPNFSSAAGFDYTLSDGTLTDTGHVTVTVTPINDAPVAGDDTATTNEDTAAVIPAATLLANDSDVDGPTPTITVVSNATGGTVALAGTDITFTPAANFAGTAGFDYTLSDGTLTDTGHVTVTVTAINDSPVAVGDTGATDEATPLVIAAGTLLANDTDVDGPTLSITAVSNAVGGSVALSGTTITFTPTPNFSSAAGFDYTVSDGTLTATGHVAVTVTGINDAPVAGDDTATTAEDIAVVITAATLLANDSDVDGPTLSITAVSGATGGAVALAGTDVTFTPSADFNGAAGFDYTLSDGTLTDTGHVTVTVSAVNDGPVAVNDTGATDEATPLVIAAATLLANDSDVDGPSLSITAVSNAVGGSVALSGTTITFTPTPNFSSAAGFDYTLSDGTLTATGHVAVTVTGINDAPVAGDDTATTAEDTAAVITAATLLANDSDVDGPTLSITAVSGATGGAVALAGTDVTFTPSADFSGAAGFDYTLSDGTLTDTGHVAVTVTAVNDAPVANDDSVTTAEDTAAVIAAATLLGNDTDVDGPTLSITAVANATGGSVALAGSTVTFTPAADSNGAGSFEYTISDGTLTATGNVGVTVTPVNDPPVAVAQSVSLDAGTSLTITLTATDIDSASTTFAIAAAPTSGTLGTITPAGALSATVVYTPNVGFAGADSFTFRANDSALNSAPATVAITVATVCGDGAVGAAEACDDHNLADSDGCSATCTRETGWNCTGSPTTCSPICGDTLVVGTEPCDDANADETDGCTSQCVVGKLCTSVGFAGGDSFATDPATGTCYAAFLTENTTWSAAQAACHGLGGYLVTITSAGEQARVHSLQVGVPWIGATDDGNDTDNVFDWVTTEAWGFAAFAAGEPDDDVGVGGNGECLAMVNTAGEWGDTNCDFTGYSNGRICEFPANPCGDGIIESPEVCDDGNRTAGDGCSATCTVESGATCAGTAPTLCSKLVINEIDYDQNSTDNVTLFEFVEILNVGTGPADLNNVALVLANGTSTPAGEYYFDGTTGATNAGKRILLTASTAGTSLPAGGIIVVAPAAQFAVSGFPAAAYRLTVVPGSGGWLQNGSPDGIALINVAGTPMVLDSFSYEGATAPVTVNGLTGTFVITEGTGSTGDPADVANANNGMSRFPNGRDTDTNSTDFSLRAVTPGLAN